MSDSRHPKDYSKGKIYCIRNTINDDIYIGSTCQSLSQRMAQHRLDKRKERNQNRRIYKMMNEVDDDNLFYIELIEDCSCENLNQLRKREGEIIREMNPQLNMQVECRNNREYYEDNKQCILSRNKNYYEEHKEYFNEWKRNEQRKTYRENNKEKIHEKQREWYENTKEEKNRKSREHYNANKEKISERRKELKALKKHTKEN